MIEFIPHDIVELINRQIFITNPVCGAHKSCKRPHIALPALSSRSCTALQNMLAVFHRLIDLDRSSQFSHTAFHSYDNSHIQPLSSPLIEWFCIDPIYAEYTGLSLPANISIDCNSSQIVKGSSLLKCCKWTKYSNTNIGHSSRT